MIEGKNVDAFNCNNTYGKIYFPFAKKNKF